MADSKHTKRALLGSALALILCFAMLLGTTFAWFTDTASTTVNTIQAGTLDVDITTEGGKSLDGVTTLPLPSRLSSPMIPTMCSIP